METTECTYFSFWIVWYVFYYSPIDPDSLPTRRNLGYEEGGARPAPAAAAPHPPNFFWKCVVDPHWCHYFTQKWYWNLVERRSVVRSSQAKITSQNPTKPQLSVLSQHFLLSKATTEYGDTGIGFPESCWMLHFCWSWNLSLFREGEMRLSDGGLGDGVVVAHDEESLSSFSFAFVLGATSLALVSLLLFRVCYVFWKIFQSRNGFSSARQRNMPMKTLVVLGSGGHTSEMLELIQRLDARRYSPMTYVIAKSDTTSLVRLQACNKTGPRCPPGEVLYLPRSREVGQSYWTSIGTTTFSLLYAFGMVLKIRPGLLLCNGPGTCLPIAVMTLLFRILGLCEGKVVFVESLCRVETLSLTGKLLYPLVDLFVVHWEELHQRYPSTKLISSFTGNEPSRLASKDDGLSTKKDSWIVNEGGGDLTIIVSTESFNVRVPWGCHGPWYGCLRGGYK